VFAQAWLILLLAAGFGAALAGVEVSWGERIESNKQAEILRRIPALVLGAELTTDSEVEIRDGLIEVQPAAGSPRALAVEELDLGGYTVFRVSEADPVSGAAGGSPMGWVVRASDQGYADVIELLVGLAPDGSRLTGLYVLSQKETPGLGDAIRGEGFRGQFEGVSTARPLEVARAGSAPGGPGEIVALTAATISSRSVCNIVNRAVDDVGEELARLLEAK
jgi:electron transport complex protein RnfG